MYGINICNKTEIKDDYDYFITYQSYRYVDFYGYRRETENNPSIDCSTMLYVPKNYSINIRMNEPVQFHGHDFLEVMIGSNEYNLSDIVSTLPPGPHDVSNIKLRYHTEYHNGYASFNFTYNFEQSLSKSILNVSEYNGIIIVNKTLHMKQIVNFMPIKSWFRYVELLCDDSDGCKYTGGNTIKVIGSNASTGYNSMHGKSFYGNEITIEIISKEIATSLSEIRYKTMKSRGIKSCYPDFDCGDMHCVPMETKCDYIHDCHNDADEIGCDISINDSGTDFDTNVDTINGTKVKTNGTRIVTHHQLPCRRDWTNPTHAPTQAPPPNEGHDHSFIYFLIGSTFMLIMIILTTIMYRIFLSKKKQNENSVSFKFAKDKLINL